MRTSLDAQQEAYDTIRENIRKLLQLVPPIQTLRSPKGRPDRVGTAYADELQARLDDIERAIIYLGARHGYNKPPLTTTQRIV